jgi:hypothetical protein
VGVSKRNAQATRWATTRGIESTVDQSDIRGLATASQRLVAGLPRSSVGDRRKDARLIETRAPRVALAHRVADRVCG